MAEKLADHKNEFIEVSKTSGALGISGDTVLKSKRESPYFMNMGKFNSGSTTSTLAIAYADVIAEHFKDKPNLLLYGIPEKGVGFLSAVTVKLWEEHKIDAKWFFTRKEAKTYGEATNLSKNELAKGMVVGGMPTGESNIVALDDVLTTSKTKYEAIETINRLVDNPKIVGFVIGVDRQEVDTDSSRRSALEKFVSNTGIPVYSITTATEMYHHISVGASEEERKNLDRMAKYIRVYGTSEARREIEFNPSNDVIKVYTSIIPACDMSSIASFDRLVSETHKLEGIGGYKIGFELALTHGLPNVVETVRKHTDKPIIYDHQKAATDIPDTAKKFMRIMKDVNIDAVILFPHSGPETERAWVYRAFENDIKVIVGGIMTHPSYKESEGGFILDEGTLDMYRIGAAAGVTGFVVPGTKPEEIKSVIEALAADTSLPTALTLYTPGIKAQGGKLEEIKKVIGRNDWHAIIGRAIANAPNGEYGKAAEENIEQLLRA